eukprot:1364354-Rhodomonas_salina.1
MAFTPHRCQTAAEFPLQQRRCGAIQVAFLLRAAETLLEQNACVDVDMMALSRGLVPLHSKKKCSLSPCCACR